MLVLILFGGALFLWSGNSLDAQSTPPHRADPPAQHAVPAPMSTFTAASPVSQAAEDGGLAKIFDQNVFWLPDASAPHAVRVAAVVRGCEGQSGPSNSQQPLVRLPPATCSGGAPSTDSDIACFIASRARHQLLLVSSSTRSEALRTTLLAARAAVEPGQLLMVTHDADVAALAQSIGVGWWAAARRPADATASRSGEVAASMTLPADAAARWHATSLLVRSGAVVVQAAAHITWRASPFPHLAADVDIEAPELGGHLTPILKTS